jgi:hypothetical protein
VRQSRLSTAAACLTLAALSLWGAAACAAPTEEFGWLEDTRQAHYLQIIRHGTEVAYNAAGGLQSCDVISVVEPAPSTARVIVVFADASRHILRPGQPAMTVGCGTSRGVSHAVAVFLRSLFVGTTHRRVLKIAASKRVCMKSPQDKDPPAADPDVALPASSGKIPTMLTSGRSSVLLTWMDAVPPVDFHLRVVRGETLAHQIVQSKTSTLRLQAKIASPGHYRLVVTDQCLLIPLEDDDIEVVPAQERPPVPGDLAELPDPARTIFYADYLAGQGDGRWALEALQLVGDLPETPLTRQWIARWTGPIGNGRPQ